MLASARAPRASGQGEPDGHSQTAPHQPCWAVVHREGIADNRFRASVRDLPEGSDGRRWVYAPKISHGAARVARCVGFLGDAINQVDSARIALVHNIGGLTAVSAGTNLEGRRFYGG
jgi:hypothetical protein